MPAKPPSPLSVVHAFRTGVRGFSRSPTTLLVRSAVVMAIPALVALIREATGNYWVNLVTWLLAVGIVGYAAWPLSRTALAAVSFDSEMSIDRDDWWVRDGFVRATAAFCFTAAVGTVFLVVPGIMVLMIYSLYPFAILEKRAKGFASLAMSSELSRGNRIPLLGLVMVSIALFAPSASLFFWGQGFWGTAALWALGAPALSLVAPTMAAAYRTVTRN